MTETGKAQAQARRKAKLAKALKDNLKKRKAAAQKAPENLKREN